MNIIELEKELAVKRALLTKCYSQKNTANQKIEKFEGEVELLERKIATFSPSNTVVTDHAIVRYIERVLENEGLINTIKSELSEVFYSYMALDWAKEGKFPEKIRGKSRYRIVVNGGKVVTVEK